MTEKTVKIITRTILWTLLGLSLILVSVFWFGLDASLGKEAQADQVNTVIVWTYILAITAALLALVFPIWSVIQNPRSAVKLLVSLGSLALVFLIAYAFSDTTPIVTATSGSNANFSDPSILLMSDIGIISVYILGGIATLLLLLTGLCSVLQR